MTLLDAAVLVFLLLVALGGYRQGLVRGVLRIGAMVAIGLLAAILSAGIGRQGDLQTLLLRTGALFAGLVIAAGMLAWMLGRSVPRVVHDSVVNRLLGVVPALLQGLLVAALLLGLIHRIAFSPELQAYVAGGAVSGPLIQPFSWLERSLAGLR